MILSSVPTLWWTKGPRQAFVWSTATLRYEPCPQFINVSQRTFHIYWQFSAMSHAIHKIVSKRRCQSYFISRRSPHHDISKDSDLCASAHRCLYLCLCAAHCSRNFQVSKKCIIPPGREYITKLPGWYSRNNQ